ncbi:MAG: hypothetical protein ACREJD_04255 [Phycisphaerales bacterium]
MLLLLLAAMPIGAVFLTTITGSDLSKALPTSALIWQSRHASREVSKSIAIELEDRLIKKTLSESQTRMAVERALEIQADWDRPWLEEWGRVVAASELTKPLDSDQRSRWTSNAAKIQIVARENVRPGDPFPIRARLVESRLSPKEMMHLQYEIESVRLDDLDASTRSALEKPIGRIRDENAELMLIAVGSESPQRGSYVSGGGGAIFVTPAEISAGEHELVVRVKAISWGPNGQQNGVPRVLRSSVKIASADYVPVQQVPPTEKWTSELVERLRKSELSWRGYARATRKTKDGTQEVSQINWMLDGIGGQLGIGAEDAGLFMNVFAVGADESETLVGTLTSEPYNPDNPNLLGAGRAEWRGVSLSEPLAAPIQLVFKPNLEKAFGTFTIRKLYMGELRVDFPTVSFRDVRSQTFRTKEEAVEQIRKLR